MAEDKPVVLVSAKATGPIFDVDNLLRVVEYDPNLWRSTIEADVIALEEHIRAAGPIAMTAVPISASCEAGHLLAPARLDYSSVGSGPSSVGL
ncbi:MAG: hypothetical protein M3083_00135 [Actinomycetota bacterium]|nr:hypothetical protein [Actinomycetota bacterium]